VFDPSGSFAYVSNYGSGDISQYSVSSDGQLLPLAPATILGFQNPTKLVASPSGQKVIEYSYFNFEQFDISKTGSLMPASGIARPNGLIDFEYDANGAYLYGISTYGSTSVPAYLYQFPGWGGGGGSNISTSYGCPNPAATGGNTAGLVVHPSGRWIYTVMPNCTYVLVQTNLQSGGALGSSMPYLSTVNYPGLKLGYSGAIAINSTGQFMYALSGGLVVQFSIDQYGGVAPLNPALFQSGTAVSGLALVVVN
jgi:6-phosphogluconolactonase (cycloisomerase 2 family)